MVGRPAWLALFAAVGMLVGSTPALCTAASAGDNRMVEMLADLHRFAASVSYGCRVKPGEHIGSRENVTGTTIRVPGATLEFYPAFWVRDAAMMLGADFVSADEVEGWVRLVCSTQAGPEGISLRNDLRVPPYSIPDHITLAGAPCWYPGAYDGQDQGAGTFGFLPPADDAFYFLQMVREQVRLRASADFLRSLVQTPYGQVPLLQACEQAYASVEADPSTGLVVAHAETGRTRVDWGFCDTVRKTGLCLFPSLLRWRAAKDMEEIAVELGDAKRAGRYETGARLIARSLMHTFSRPAPGEGRMLLVSATGVGQREDVWGEAYAVWLGVLPDSASHRIALRLADLARNGGTVVDGQVRHMPLVDSESGYWDQCVAKRGTYQNGAYWGTPTGWLVSSLMPVDRPLAEDVLKAYLAHIHAMEPKGAPWECCNPSIAFYQNPRYTASVALPYVAIRQWLDRHGATKQ